MRINATTAPQSPALPALRRVTSPRIVRRFANFLVAALLATLGLLLLAPWQQNIRGSGQVIAFAPVERQQAVESPISGRIAAWGESIREGAHVDKGQKILEIRDNDPQLIGRLEQQREALRLKLEASQTMANAYQTKLEAFRVAQKMAITAATQEVEMAKQKLEAERQGLAAAEAARFQAQANLQRQQQLIADQLASTYDVEIADRAYREAAAKVKQAQAYVSSAENGLEAKKAEREQKTREAEGKTETARAEYQKARSEAATAQKELSDIEVKLAQQRSQVVVAPRDGIVLRLLVNPEGQWVKAGDPLLMLVPDASQRAVELWVAGNDAPLIEAGRHVRLQFEGWPAVQFAGWPSVAVGTFGGTVSLVDATDDGRGRFRVLVVPNQGEPWPSGRFLRQGVRANGWILLNQVKLGYELWRRMNGFPPVVSMEEPKDKSTGFGEKSMKVKPK